MMIRKNLRGHVEVIERLTHQMNGSRKTDIVGTDKVKDVRVVNLVLDWWMGWAKKEWIDEYMQEQIGYEERLDKHDISMQV
jgi:hypothetical protein